MEIFVWTRYESQSSNTVHYAGTEGALQLFDRAEMSGRCNGSGQREVLSKVAPTQSISVKSTQRQVSIPPSLSVQNHRLLTQVYALAANISSAYNIPAQAPNGAPGTSANINTSNAATPSIAIAASTANSTQHAEPEAENGAVALLSAIAAQNNNTPNLGAPTSKNTIANSTATNTVTMSVTSNHVTNTMNTSNSVTTTSNSVTTTSNSTTSNSVTTTSNSVTTTSNSVTTTTTVNSTSTTGQATAIATSTGNITTSHANITVTAASNMETDTGHTSSDNADSDDTDVDDAPTNELQGDDVFAALGIKGKRKRNGQIEYKIRWKGYKPKDDTWEPTENVCADMIKAWEEKNKKPRKE